ncbi:MAG: sigma-70 family RNA polymerase sigma factor [Verrucomicrobia bacterium]|nr:sigma-70 family RNA polymerase sigma factor [Verrucomicrobiota bacterium]
MSDSSSNPADSGPGSHGQFAETRWSMVLAARRGGDSSRAGDALAKLCQAYWYPLYAFVRRQGHAPHDAQDLTQEFFARLLEKNWLADVDRAKGRFRSFLLAALKHFLANEWDKSKALKRGGGIHNFISLDAESAESRYAMEPADAVTADKLYERRWALTLLDTTLARLRAEFVADGKAKQFDELKFTLTGGRGETPYSELAAKFGMSEGAVKVSVHRLRQRYREVLRAQIAETVATAAEVEEELRHLFAALS